jgi:outer membrane receptor protein involved in Fe transport
MTKIKLPKNSIYIAACLLFSVTVNAQSGTGKLTGKITDSSTNQSLSAVSITALKTKLGAASIGDGTYILSLPVGTYTIRYSSSGYESQDITEIVIKKGETTFMDVTLAPKTNQMEGVVIKSIPAKKATQAAVYSKQRLSSAASDGIGADVISKTPDNNAGQILKRITGLSVQNEKFVVVRGLGAQYNQTMLNGVAMTSTETNQNAFSFDLIPAAAIDNIVVNKTATPDMPGNFAGGVVQVNTKDFPAKDFFSVGIQAAFSDQTFGKDFYSDKRSGMEWLGFGGKTRDLPDGFPKAADRVPFTNLNPQEFSRYKVQLKNNLVPVNNGPSGKDLADLNENLQFGFGKTIVFKSKNQIGIVAAVTQRKSELIEKEITYRDPKLIIPVPEVEYFSNNTRYKYSSELAGVLNLAYSFGANKITLKSLYSQVFRNNFIKRDSVIYNIDLYITAPEPGIEGFSYLTEERSLLNSILAGEHKTGQNKETILDWNINVTTNGSKFPDTRNFILLYDGKSNYSTGLSGTNFPIYIRTSSRVWSDAKDLITGGAFNLTSVFKLFKTKQIIKGGILFQNRQRSSLATVLPLDIPDPSPIDSVLSPSKYSIQTTVGQLLQETGNYIANTSLQAAYESIEHKWGKYLRIIWGMRFENYQQSSNAYQPLYDPNFQSPELLPVRFATRSSFDFLPSINIIYSPTKSINFRAAYSKTVIRPDLRDIIGTTRFDFQLLQVSTGNPELKSTGVTNYDFKFEFFPAAGEILSFGAFYKKMIDPIEYGQIPPINVFIGRLAVNTGDAFVRGLEAEFRKKLDFISFAPWLKNITVFGNGALLKSSVKDKIIYNPFYDFSPAHPLTGQPKYIINGGLSISAFKNTFEVTASYNRTGDYIDQLGSSDFLVGQNSKPYGKPLLQIPNYILQARDIIDVSIRQALLKGKALIKVNIGNLLSKPLLIYQDFDGNDKFNDPIKITTGPRSTNPGVITGGIDNIFSLTNGQRNFSLAFTYTF